MSLLSRVGQQLKSLSEELQEPPKHPPDPIKLIEVNAALLKTKTPEIADVLITDGDDNESIKDGSDTSASKEVSKESEQSQPTTGNTSQDPSGGRSKTASTEDTAADTDPSSKKASAETSGENSGGEAFNSPSRAPSPSKGTPPKGLGDQKTSVTIEAKLAKFAKYEEKYPQLLRAYRLEKKKAELVKTFEKVLSEATPCQSIAEPQQMLNFIQGLHSRNDLLKQELERVSKTHAADQNEIKDLRKELARQSSRLETMEASASANSKPSQPVQDEQTRAKEAQDLLEPLRDEVKGLKQQNQSKEAELKSIMDKLRTAESGQDQLKTQIAHIKTQLSNAEESRSKDRILLEERQAQIQQLSAQVASSRAAEVAATKAQAMLRTQLDEMGQRLSEASAAADMLREEAADSAKQAQERQEEVQTLRELVRKGDRNRNQQLEKVRRDLEQALAEREQLETEVETLGKRLVRETGTLEAQVKSLREQLAHAEAEASDRASIETGASQKFQQQEQHAEEPPHLKAQDRADIRALEEARQEVLATTKANDLLKKVNEDTAARVERLQKSHRALVLDIEALRAENQHLRELRQRRLSVSGSEPTPEPAESEEKQRTYMKNVLLGFLEHRDQRRHLLPVVSQLLSLDQNDEQRFWRALN